jgi:hypothetical protein
MARISAHVARNVAIGECGLVARVSSLGSDFHGERRGMDDEKPSAWVSFVLCHRRPVRRGQLSWKKGLHGDSINRPARLNEGTLFISTRQIRYRSACSSAQQRAMDASTSSSVAFPHPLLCVLCLRLHTASEVKVLVRCIPTPKRRKRVGT